MSDNFYLKFEDRYRGSRDLIKSRLRVYLPFITPLKNEDADANVIDLGCGRGEWLELLKAEGINAHGIDLDSGMLSACEALDLSVQIIDAVSYLQSLPDESQTVVSAFHLVEHVTFEYLQTLVSQVFRVLKPGGLLIMETPNPENIVIATRDFYLDPTHQKPIPPGLLSFLPEFYDFARTKVIRLQESKELATKTSLTLQDVFSGVSPDYAVVAQKAATAPVLSKLNTPFKKEYGLSLENLTGRYQDQISERFDRLEAKAIQAEDKAIQAEDKAIQAEANVHLVLHNIINSRSWRITAPLRWCAQQWHYLREHGLRSRVKAHIKKIARPILRRGITFIGARPTLRAGVVTLARRLGFYSALSSLHWRLSGHSPALTSTVGPGNGLNQQHKSHQMTPGALRVYADLKTAIDKNKGIN